MKVCDLLENDWINDPNTLNYLYKKQVDMSQQFSTKAQNIGFDRDIDYLEVPGWSSQYMKEFENRVYISYGVLKKSFERMIEAKQQYEQAGGKLTVGPAVIIGDKR